MNKIKGCYISPWRYPSNWIRNIKEIFHLIKRRIQRGRYGICLYDVWDMDSYLLEVFNNGLEIFKEGCPSYPGYIKKDEWQSILTHMQELIKIVQTDGVDCEEAEKYYGKDDKRWFEEVKKWDEYRVDCWNEFCDLMKEWYFHLWW